MKLIRKKGITYKDDFIILCVTVVQMLMIVIFFRTEFRLLNNPEQTLVLGIPFVMIITWIIITVKVKK